MFLDIDTDMTDTGRVMEVDTDMGRKVGTRDEDRDSDIEDNVCETSGDTETIGDMARDRETGREEEGRGGVGKRDMRAKWPL